MKTITKQTKLLADYCKICKQQITGYSEKQVNHRMKRHMDTHGNSVGGGKKQ